MIQTDMNNEQYVFIEQETVYQGHEIANLLNSTLLKFLEGNYIDTILLIFINMLEELWNEEESNKHDPIKLVKIKGML